MWENIILYYLKSISSIPLGRHDSNLWNLTIASDWMIPCTNTKLTWCQKYFIMLNFQKQRGSDLYDNYIWIIYFNQHRKTNFVQNTIYLAGYILHFHFPFFVCPIFRSSTNCLFCSHILIFFPAYNTVAQQRATDGTMIDGDNSQVPLKR